MKAASQILVIRLGAMGDVIHALPAIAELKRRQPDSHLTWVIEAKWAPLLEDNPFIDRVVLLRRNSLAALIQSARVLRESRYDLAIDFQGLIKSALVAVAAQPPRIYGFSETRESVAAVFYTHRVAPRCAHVVDRNVELVAHAMDPAMAPTDAPPARPRGLVFPLPAGRPEGDLPAGDFVLASPLAGWAAKQWPMEHYRAVAARLRAELGIPLVLNGPPGVDFAAIGDALAHHSGLPGLIHATRRSAAVIGVDSGPLHLAAAFDKPGVAIFGPTDPARNGPYGDSLRVLRSPAAGTTYKRKTAIDRSMQDVAPDEVFAALKTLLPTGCLS
jgi:heptosyltransferase I